VQDVRLRIGSATILSLAAFFSIPGAVAAGTWWLLFGRDFSRIRKSRLVLPSVILIGFYSIILHVTGGDGISYFFRMMVVILIAAWFVAEQEHGEFLAFGCWLLGERAGFELGMLAEMGLGSLHALIADFDRIRDAERMKGVRSGIAAMIPAGRVLIHRTLMRAEDTAELLAVRGYTCGGTLVPRFITTKSDLVAAGFVVFAAAFAMIPVSEFFILS
jgi:energy-coupling factor transport system permease protein